MIGSSAWFPAGYIRLDAHGGGVEVECCTADAGYK